MRTGLLSALVCLAGGCADIRYVLIRANPPDAEISVNNVARGRGPVNEKLVFNSPEDIYNIRASRPGYRDLTETITHEDSRQSIALEMRPQSKRITIRVEPAPAIVKIDGNPPLSFDPVSAISADPEFGLDARGAPVRHVIRAERDNFLPAERVIAFADPEAVYVLKLEQMKKPLTITSDPPGAEIYLDGKRVGLSPVTLNDVPFPVDLETNNFIPRNLRAVLPGYEPAETPVSWDGGRSAYPMKLGLRQKEVHLFVDPPDATVKIDGQPITNDKSGVVAHLLTFAPTNLRGDLQSYNLEISKKTDEIEYEPRVLTLGWDNGQIDYRVGLKEIPAHLLSELAVGLHRNNQGWQVLAETLPSLSYRDVGERPGRPQAQAILRLPRDVQLGSFALSPDGSKIVYSQLSQGSGQELRSRLLMIASNGQGTPVPLTDGQFLDIMPAFTPNGDKVLFSSSRGGKRMSIWSVPADGGEPQRLTSGESSDVWPALDRDPKPRLFYQAVADARAEPGLYQMPLGSAYPVDLGQPGASQPRIGPRNDALIFTAVESRSKRRDIFRSNDAGNLAVNLTNTPQADEYDASWSREGTRIVFASDRSADPQGRHNFDIWMADSAPPNPVTQLTANGSLDDGPVFDVLGDWVYFRSNRGGQWGIWKISIK